MKVLLVWQLVPEEVKFYILTDVTAEQQQALVAQNFVIGGSVDLTEEQTHAHECVAAAICGPEFSGDYVGNGVTPDWLSIWHDKEVTELSIDSGPFDMVFTGGFFL